MIKTLKKIIIYTCTSRIYLKCLFKLETNPFNSFSIVIGSSIFMYDLFFLFFKEKNIVSKIFKEWYHSNDVLFMLFNCSILLFWSFCEFSINIYSPCNLYCFTWLQQETANMGRYKNRENCNTQKIQYF